MTTDLATDWPNVETDMVAWRQWANLNQEHNIMPAAPRHHTSNDEVYAQQLIEVLSDAIDILNEAKADGIVLQFQISQVAPEGHYALTSLTATKPIVVPPPANVPAPQGQ